MSRAFLRETTLEEEEVIPRPMPLLPFGTRNYMTARGIECLGAELNRLVEREGPSLARLPQEDPDTKRLRQILSRRIDYLRESLRTAETPLRPADRDRVEFGSTVTVRDSHGFESTYLLVGVDEADAGKNRISWIAPIARVGRGATRYVGSFPGPSVDQRAFSALKVLDERGGIPFLDQELGQSVPVAVKQAGLGLELLGPANHAGQAGRVAGPAAVQCNERVGKASQVDPCAPAELAPV